MQTGTYKIADEIVQITSLYSDVHDMLRDYVSSEKATTQPQPNGATSSQSCNGSESKGCNESESKGCNGSGSESEIIHIETTEEEIRKEQEMSDEEMRYEGHEEIQYPAGYLETLAIYRKLCGALASRNVMLMHGSVIAVDGQGYLFTAASGTGKSTHVRLWRKRFGDRAVMVNDDKPLIRVAKEENGPDEANKPNGSDGTNGVKVIVYGTPWDGKHHLSNNIAVPLKAICILERGEKNEIHKISPFEAFPMLIQQSHRPTDAASFMKVMEMLKEVAQNVGLYRLHCNMEDEAAKVSYEGMQG